MDDAFALPVNPVECPDMGLFPRPLPQLLCTARKPRSVAGMSAPQRGSSSKKVRSRLMKAATLAPAELGKDQAIVAEAAMDVARTRNGSD